MSVRGLALRIPVLSLFVAVGATSPDPRLGQCPTTWASGAPLARLTGDVRCTTTWDPDGPGPEPFHLVVGGAFLRGGAVAERQRVMTWDGTQWDAIGDGPGTDAGGGVNDLVVWNGLLVAAGSFSGGPDNLAMWNGSSWQSIGAGPGFPASELAVWNGNLVVTGGGLINTISIWNGAVWSDLPPSTLSLVNDLVSYQGLLCAGGSTSSAGGALERWNGTSWLPTIHADDSVLTLAVRSFSLLSTLYVGGKFSNIGGTPAARIASTTGGTAFAWSAVGNGLPGDCWGLHARATSPVGSAVVAEIQGASTPVMQLVGSSFVPMGNVAVSDITYYGGSYHGLHSAGCSRYDGSAWVPVVAQGIVGEIRALAASGTDMIVGGTIQSTAGPQLNRIARWNGTTWSPLGTGMNGDVHALAVRSDGRLLAGGAFTTAGGVGCSHVAQWNGSSWSPLALGVNGDVHALAVRSNDEVVATGSFTTVIGIVNDRCARWNGTTWLPMGAGSADPSPNRALCVLPNGGIVVGRDFHPPSTDPDTGIARWSNFVCSSFGSGLESASADPLDAVAVRAIVQRSDGALVVGGDFGVAGGLAASGLATLTSSCPAQAVPFGSGCTAAGPLVQTSESLPWMGATFRTETTGLQPSSLCFEAIGFAPTSIPLAAVLPEGQPGCTLLVSPDLLDVVIADGSGTAQASLALANDLALLGGVFHLQTIPLELNGTGALTAVRAANAITATIGRF